MLVFGCVVSKATRVKNCDKDSSHWNFGVRKNHADPFSYWGQRY